MLDFLDRVRLLPLTTRRRIAGGVALLCTVSVFVLWLGFGPLGPARDTERLASPSPIASLKESVGSLWGSVSSRMTALTDGFKSIGVMVQDAASSTLATSSLPQATAPLETNGVVLTDSFITTSIATGTSSQ